MSKRVCSGENPVVVDARGVLWTRKGKFIK